VKTMALRFACVCSLCSATLSKGCEAVWDSASRSASCVEHASPVPDLTTSVDSGQAGASAQAEYEKRLSNWQEKVRTEHPLIGGLLLAINDEPHHVRVWATGARGETAVGSLLDREALEHGYGLLHDRRIRGTRANIDHILVTSRGVYVIDAKNYTGMVTIERSGGWLSAETATLRVGKRDCSSLVDSVLHQVELVSDVLSGGELSVPVEGVLAFHSAEWPWIGKPQKICGVHINGKGIAPVVSRPGPLTADQIAAITRYLSACFPRYQP
jgi:hypothetical protein